MSVLLLIAVSLAACWPTTIALHDHWTDWALTTYTHGYLVAAVSLYLLWRANVGQRDVAAPVKKRVVPMMALAAAALLWVLGVRAGIVAVEWLLLPILPLLAVWVAFGPAVARRNVFPLGFLYFAVPLWGSVNGLLQSATVLAVRGLLRLAGIPSHFSGNFVQIPAGMFEIEGGCSGLHYVIVALALGALMGELREDNLRGRLKLILLAGALAVVTNWVRVFTIILAGHYTDMQHYLVTESHYNYGWALFAVAMVLFFLIERRLPVRKSPMGLSSLVSQQPAGDLSRSRVFVAFAILAAMAFLQSLSARRADASVPMPVPTGGWSLVSSPASDWMPIVEGSDAQRAGIYEHVDVAPVQRRQYLFAMQRQGKELGGYGDDVGGGHVVVRTETSLFGNTPVTLHEARDPSGASWLIASTYGVGRKHFAKPLPAQLSYAAHSVARLRSVMATITMWRTPCMPDCKEAEKVLSQFVRTMETDS